MSSTVSPKSIKIVAYLTVVWSLDVSFAEDWPEWRGRGRLGVWNDTDLVDSFDGPDLRPKWRHPVGAGYSGPAVAGGRVFVTEFVKSAATRGTERAVCLDERTGRLQWTHSWDVDYRGLDYASGPRATPTVDGDRVYILGATGVLHCLRANSGAVVWKKDFARDYSTKLPTWGMSSAPLVDGPRLIAVVGGSPDAKVVAFDKLTGREIWRSLGSDTEPGYSQPILIEAGGARQLIVWHTAAVEAIDPVSGQVLWSHFFKVHMNTPIATPVRSGPFLLVSGFFNGSRMLRLDAERPAATLAWRGSSDSEVSSDGLHSLMAAPVIDGEYIYGICSYGQLRCLKLATGQRVWETQDVTRERARNASAHIVRNGGRYFISNDRGELIIARLSPAGYNEVSRARLIRPTSPPGARRELGAVNWSHPAYANRHVFARNDEEIVCVPLAAR